MSTVKKVFGKTWVYGAVILSVSLFPTFHASYWLEGILLYLVLIAVMLGFHKRLWANIKWSTRKPRRHLLWWLGRRWYWVYRGGIVEVVIRDRDNTLWGAMEYRTWDDGTKSLNNFSAHKDSFFRTKDEAIKELIQIRDYELNAVREYHEGRESKNGR